SYMLCVITDCFLFPPLSPALPCPLSLHDALPISTASHFGGLDILVHNAGGGAGAGLDAPDIEFDQALELNVLAGLRAARENVQLDRKSTRLNSSHRTISYAVFCLKKKNKTSHITV